MTICVCCEGVVGSAPVFSDHLVTLRKCNTCRTILVEHKRVLNRVSVEDDWADPFYQNSPRLASLISTRKRQALLILRKLSKLCSPKSIVLDYGCGLGVFLGQAIKSGWQYVIGVDISRIALVHISRTLPAIPLFTSIEQASDFVLHDYHKIEVLVALDVIEHLPTKTLVDFPLSLSLPEKPKVVVVKVPVTSGFLFCSALLLARGGVAKSPLYQMLQIGDTSPHLTYFSRGGLVSLLKRSGYSLQLMVCDLDYEPFAFSSRLGIHSFNISLIIFLIMPIISVITRILRMHDSAIFFFADNDICGR